MKRAICFLLALTMSAGLSGCSLVKDLHKNLTDHKTPTTAATIPPDLPIAATEPSYIHSETEPEIPPTHVQEDTDSVTTLKKQLQGHWVCWYDGVYLFSFLFDTGVIQTGFYPSECVTYNIKSVESPADNTLEIYAYAQGSPEEYGLDYNAHGCVFTVTMGIGDCTVSCNGGEPIPCNFAGTTSDELYAFCDKFY